MNKTEKPILLIDASIYIFQYYFSLPDHWFSEEESWPTAAVYGYTAFLIRLLATQKPQSIAACFDESLNSCFRNEIYSQYKSSRALPDDALVFQLESCKQVTELLGIKTFSSERYEADDLIGSLYKTLKHCPPPIAILTRDKDLGQLIKTESDYLWDYGAYKPAMGEASLRESQYYYHDLVNKWGVKPEQFSDFLSLVGDSIDDIPGVPGIGKKTAMKLLKEFNTIEVLFEKIDKVENLSIRGAKKLTEKLMDYQEQIFMAKKLATIYCDIPLIKNEKEIVLKKHDVECLSKYFTLMGFPKLINRLKLITN